jgi:hypothetical protein
MLVSKTKQEDFFINLNYDTGLDQVIWKINEENKPRSGKTGDPYLVDYAMTEENYVTNKQQEPLLNPYPTGNRTIFKIHGSINWVKQNDGKILITPYACEANLVNQMSICPPGNKDIDGFKLIHEKLKERLPTADELIVIGCSISEDDSHLLDLIELWKEGGNKNAKVVYGSDERDNAKERRYENIIGVPTQCRYGGFTVKSMDFIFSKK